MKHIKHIILSIIVVVLFIVALSIYQKETTVKYLKKDLIELSGVKYGMFNVDQWKDRIATILTKKVQNFKIDNTNREELEKKINIFLTNAVNELERDMRKKNEKESFLGIDFKNFVADLTNVYTSLHESIPKISKQILEYIDKKENKEKIKEFLLLQLDKYTNETFAKIDYTGFNKILSFYGATNKEQCVTKIDTAINNINKQLNKLLIIFALLVAIIFFLLITKKGDLSIHYIYYLSVAFILLFLGILLPMIDIDARISSMSFKLLGESIHFENQVLYYKSKSILEVVSLMFTQGDVKVILVGILIMTFSVIFPLIKLITTVFYIFSAKAKQNKYVDFIVFKIGKWSMADVMVIAIFMSYIGFTSIITNQLSQLDSVSNNLNIISSNHSNLQHGFYFFTGFVILSLIISQKLANKMIR